MNNYTNQNDSVRKITDHHQLHKKIYYCDKIITGQLRLTSPTSIDCVDITVGDKLRIRVEEFDWGNIFSAYKIIGAKIYLKTKTIGLVPVVTDLEMEKIIKNEIK